MLNVTTAEVTNCSFVNNYLIPGQLTGLYILDFI